MTLAYWMVLAAALLPYVAVVAAKWPGGIDNRAPRPDMEKLTGWRRRADWAHRNHFEAFAPFAAGVFVAELAEAQQAWIDDLAVLFVVLRIVYTLMYLADRPTLRSTVWALGFLCVIFLFLLAA